MKAALINQFGSPGVFEIKDIPKPAPKPKQLLVKAYASSLNPIDFKQRKGNHKFIMGSNFPIQLGYDVAGIVESVGNEITEFKAGDRVCGVLNNKYGGAYAEFVLGQEKCFTKLPDTIDFKTGAALPMVGLTILQSFRDKLKLGKNQTILVNGAAGGLGHVAVQMANNLGAKVIAVTSEKHIPYVESLNPAYIIDYKQNKVLNISEKFDVFYDAVGVYSYRHTRHLINRGGAYFTTLPRPKLLGHKLLAALAIKKVKTHLMKHNTIDLQELVKMVENSVLNIKIEKVFSLEQIADAHSYMEQGHTEGKIVVEIAK